MITFKQFLVEAGKHKTEISVEEAIKLINTHCRDAMKEPLYRGMTPESDAFILHGEASKRSSANTSNYYTVILDHFLPPHGYPKRSESIILADNFGTARGFGTVYAVFPYDGVKIGVCSADDLWYSPHFKVGNAEESYRIENWNGVWREYGLSSSSYEEFVASIKEKMAEDTKVARMLTDIFGTPDNVEPALKKAYSPETLDMNLATTKDIEEYRGGEGHELWIGGKCVAIEYKTWQRMQKDETDNELAPEDD